MSGTLVLKNDATIPEGRCVLYIRRHDLSGTDYERVAIMTISQGHDISALDRGPQWLFDAPDQTEWVCPGRLLIAPNYDAGPGDALWTLNIDREEDEDPERIAFLSNERLYSLMALRPAVEFVEGEPDWDRNDRLVKRFRIRELREQADRLEEMLDQDGPDP